MLKGGFGGKLSFTDRKPQFSGYRQIILFNFLMFSVHAAPVAVMRCWPSAPISRASKSDPPHSCSDPQATASNLLSTQSDPLGQIVGSRPVPGRLRDLNQPSAATAQQLVQCNLFGENLLRSLCKVSFRRQLLTKIETVFHSQIQMY